MTFAKLILALVVIHIAIEARADILGGQCRAQAQAARDSVAGINHSESSEPTTVLLDENSTSPAGPIESYFSGAYTITVNKGSDDYSSCSIMSVTFSPQP